MKDEISEFELIDFPQHSRSTKINLPASMSETGASIQTTAYEYFEAQTRRTPENTALVFENEKLSYIDLNGRANQLARHLIDKGAGPNTLIGVHIKRSIDMVLAILAIWKSGAAYLPIDTTLPASRIKYILEDSTPALLITQKSLAGAASALSTEILCIDDEELNRQLSSHACENIEIKPAHSPADLAYVIYTSGSTGKPKGVMIEHRSVTNLLIALSLEMDLAGHPHPYNALLNASISFDASVQQFVHLLEGGTLHILSDECRQDPTRTADYIVDKNIHFFDTTPSHMRFLMDRLSKSRQPDHSLCILIGGEAIDCAFWSALASLPNSRCFNVYGPTECTVDATIARIQFAGEKPTIGHPLPNVECYVLDGQGQSVAVSEAGELYIGGEGVARGYLNRPELTQERFSRTALSTKSQSRIYRTGDKVRLLADGNLEYIGRIDNQVKLRGYRIELEEIEANINAHAGVAQSAVVVAGAGVDKKRLVAHILPFEEKNFRDRAQQNFVSALKTALADQLPPYMIPSQFNILQEMPYTSSGKIDRLKLANLDLSDLPVAEYAAPESNAEKSAVLVWENLLSRTNIGVNDNFFDIGGNSLLAAKVVAELSDALGFNFSIQDIFSYPTIREFVANHYNFSRPPDRGSQKASMLNKFGGGEIELVSFQESMFYGFGGAVSPPLQLTVAMTGVLDIEALKKGLFEIVENHQILRTKYFKSENSIRRHVDSPNSFLIGYSDLMGIDAAERSLALQAIIDRDADSIKLEGPIFKATIVREKSDIHHLLLTVGHIAFDMTSFDILIKEISSSYRRHVGDGEPVSQPSILQYSDFALWQSQYFAGNVFEQNSIYWKEILSNLPPPLNLPLDHARPAVSRFFVKSLASTIPEHLAHKIKGACRNHGITLFMFFLAAFNLLLGRYANGNDVLMLYPVSNRNRSDLDNIVGCFVNMAIFRTKVNLDSTIRDFVSEIRSNSIRTYENQNFPFLFVQKLAMELYGGFPMQLMQILIDVNYNPAQLDLPGLESSNLSASQRRVTNEREGIGHDLALIFKDSETDIETEIFYNAMLFSEKTVHKIRGDLLYAIEAVTNETDCRLSEFYAGIAAG